jgi:hypothetical protein
MKQFYEQGRKSEKRIVLLLVFSGGFGFCFHTQMRSVDQWTAISAAGPSKRASLLVDLACAQDGAGELEDTTLQDPSPAEENDDDLGWCHQLPSNKAAVHQCVG